MKASILGLVSIPFGLSASESLKIGLTLGQGGEFGFVLFALAEKLVGSNKNSTVCQKSAQHSCFIFLCAPYTQGFLPEEVNQILVVVIVSTMALTPVMAEVAVRLVRTLLEDANSRIL